MNVDIQFDVWPTCSKCSAPWAFRRAMTIEGGWKWLWTRDCKCRGASHVMTAAGGPCDQYGNVLPIETTGGETNGG